MYTECTGCITLNIQQADRREPQRRECRIDRRVPVSALVHGILGIAKIKKHFKTKVNSSNTVVSIFPTVVRNNRPHRFFTIQFLSKSEWPNNNI